MARSPVLMVGLDGFELGIANGLLAQGKLPALRRLTAAGATVLLDHGAAKRTGLAWEHVSSGRDPDSSRRWGAVDFDPRTYRAAQCPTRLTPFLDGLDVSAVVFDAPYFDLSRAPNASGLVAWGAHDPGVAESARPSSLVGEIRDRFGPYPATQWIYGFTWPSAARTEAMADALTDAVHLRSAITQWLLAERFPDWDLGFVVVSEYHSAIEAMWHGVDHRHPLHGEPSAAPAKRGVESVYEAGDEMIGALMDRFPAARMVVFSMHGMGPNNADIPSMLLLPELLYRHHFGKPFLRPRQWPETAGGVPILGPETIWRTAISGCFPYRHRVTGKLRRKLSAAAGRSSGGTGWGSALEWMPATQYRPFWREMPAFALPAYYDGRIRLNLAGRERNGIVRAEQYDLFCETLENLIGECTDPISGDPVVAGFTRPKKDKFELTSSEADIIVDWAGAPLGLNHPRLGQIGPVPYRRPGGHTGGNGVAFFSDPGSVNGARTASSFDVVPTVISMLGAEPVPGLSGRSLT